MNRLLIALGIIFFTLSLAIGLILYRVSQSLPQLITVNDYKPLLVSEVYDRNGQQIGELFRDEKRTLVPFEQIPKLLVQAFLAAEDGQFYEHGGINFSAIFRAFIANLRAGRTVQGGSTITQQVAKTLLLTPERTLLRKVREAILAYRMEANLSKDEILYLYLNQIYLGQGAYGVKEAARVYFRKDLDKLNVEEMAMLAGLPQAPSRYSPISNPKSAKDRQNYVLTRMADVGFINAVEAKALKLKPVIVYRKKDYKSDSAFYLEIVRQLLIQKLGEKTVLDEGIKIYTGLDLAAQKAANEAVEKGLRELDKRQGYRGAKQNLATAADMAKFLVESKNEILLQQRDELTIFADGTSSDARLKQDEAAKLEALLTKAIETKDPLLKEFPQALPPHIKPGEIVPGVVTQVDDVWGLVYVRFADGRGLIDFSSMDWARQPNPANSYTWDKIKKPSQALKVGDVIDVKIFSNKFFSSEIDKKLLALKQKQKAAYQRPATVPDFTQYAELNLEQVPIAEASLLSFDLETQEIIAMVGGYDFNRSEFNRSVQASRQTGSAFKSIVYLAALDKGYTPATSILDAPIVFEEEIELKDSTTDEAQIRRWKPENHGNKFRGDILFRTALINSLNVPTIRITEKIGVEWISEYARRLGIVSPLNMDMTLALGSSGVTLYEMNKVFANIARLGKRIRPLILHRVVARDGTELLQQASLDERFQEMIEQNDKKFDEQREAYLAFAKIRTQLAVFQMENPELDEESARNEFFKLKGAEVGMPLDTFKKFQRMPQLYFEDPDQLISPETAYITTTLLQGVVEEGTGAKARALGRPAAGKTGTTNDYYDAWFMGYTPQVASGVWVGFDEERKLGAGEVGGTSALPIWVDYMKNIHSDLPERSFSAPEGIVYVNIDNETGALASASSKSIVRQAFQEGREPKSQDARSSESEAADFLKEDFTE